MPRKLPWVIVSESATETARYLIQQAGGVQAARDAVTRAAGQQKRKHGAPTKPDEHWLLFAEAFQRQENCSDEAALRQIAEIVCGRGTAKSRAMLRRLRRKLNRKPLAVVARGLPGYGLVGFKKEDKEIFYGRLHGALKFGQ